MNKVYYLPKFQSGGKSPDKTKRILKDIGETILDFTPIVGDIKGLTIDPYRAYKEEGWKGALSMAGLGLIGLIPGVGDIAKKAGKIVLKSVDDVPFIFRNNFLKEIRELSDATSNISRQTYVKPWKSDPSKSNQAIAYRLKNKPDQYFEVVKDNEPGYYSVHFKTDQGALTEEEKTELIKAIYDDLPEGAKLSTWGEVSKGGFSGIDRFRTQMGMIPTNELRTVGVKSQNTPDEIVERFGYTKNLDGTISFPILLKQKQVGNYTEKQRDRHLSRSYEGQYATSPEEQFTRVNNTSQDRVKWIKEHPVKSLPSNTTIEEQIEFADRNWANEYLSQFRKALDENVEYSSKKLGKNVFGESEGNILTGPFGNPPEGQIQTIFSKEDKTPIAKTTLGHEAAIHGSGNLDDEYIYQYLKENDIVDFGKVSPYFKDADRGEIGAHLSEIPSYLGFKKETPTSKYQTPEGKTKINKDDIINYNRFQREDGIDTSQTITGNIKNWPEFLKFMNGHRFIWTLPLFGVGTAKILNTENYEHNQTGN